MLGVLKKRQLSLRRSGDKLILVGPKESKTDTLLSLIEKSKKELLDFLEKPETATCIYRFCSYSLNGRTIQGAMPEQDFNDCYDLWAWTAPHWLAGKTRKLNGIPKEWELKQW